ncbi:MAG: peptide-methionine (R)-S-oxide reductase MsrB [Phormidesmis sp.]
MKKRYFLQTGAAFVGAIALTRYLPTLAEDQSTSEPSEPQTKASQAKASQAKALDSDFEVVKTEAEWQEILTPEEFDVLRQQATEPPFSSPLDKQSAPGTYHCAGCNQPVYSSTTKFDSGTGWPSFYASLEDAVATSADRSFFMTRTEVHCDRCGGHLGHIFDDGPAPTGKRHCLNGVALNFIAS